MHPLFSHATRITIILFSMLFPSCHGPNSPVSVIGTDTPIAPKAVQEIIEDSTGIQMASVKADEYWSNFPPDSIPANIEKQLPASYLPLVTVSGDLNRDSIMDWLVSLRHISEDSVEQGGDSPWSRKLLVFTGTGNGNYQLKAANDSAIYCKTCGGMMGDPFTGFTIKNGYFSIENFGGSNWRWQRIITFKYSAKQDKWFLHKDSYESFHTSDVEKTTLTISTVKDFGIVPFEQFNIFDN